MPVVVNEFEVVTAPQGEGQERQPQAAEPAAPPDAAKAREELERSLHELHRRAARLHAS